MEINPQVSVVVRGNLAPTLPVLPLNKAVHSFKGHFPSGVEMMVTLCKDIYKLYVSYRNPLNGRQRILPVK